VNRVAPAQVNRDASPINRMAPAQVNRMAPAQVSRMTPVFAPVNRVAPAFAPVNRMAPSSSKNSLINQSKTLQLIERNFNSKTILGNCGVNISSPVKYSISMFIKIEKTHNAWRNIFIRGNSDGTRFPSIYIIPNTLKFHYRHGTNSDTNAGIDSTINGLIAGQYAHVVFLNDGNKLEVYINGIKDNVIYTKPTSSVFQWGNSDQATSMMPPHNSVNGYVNMKELYWFNKVLSQDEINLLKA
jgi:hypothetical protein